MSSRSTARSRNAGQYPGRRADQPDSGRRAWPRARPTMPMPRRVAVFRTIGGQRQAAAFDLTAIRRGQAPDPQIYPGDIIVVDGSSIKAVQKQIFQACRCCRFSGPSEWRAGQFIQGASQSEHQPSCPERRAVADRSITKPDATQLGPGQRTYSATNILDFATLMRIIHHWRWLVLGAVALGLAGAVLATLLTKPVYRAWVTLEANPPTVSVTSDQANDRDASAPTVDNYDFIATQVGLGPEQERGGADGAGAQSGEQSGHRAQDVDASKRLRVATGVVAGGLEVIAPETGELIKFSYDSTSPAARGDDRQRRCRQLHQHGAPAALRSFGLRPQLPRTADRQDPRRSRAFGARARRLCPGAGHHQHPAESSGPDERRRHRLAPGRIAGQAQRCARRRDCAPRGRGRRVQGSAFDRADGGRRGTALKPCGSSSRSFRPTISRSAPS